MRNEKYFMDCIREVVGHKPLIIKVKKLDARAVIPKYAHNGDVGMDLTAISVEYDRDNDMYIYHTGISIESDMNFGAFLYPRSSNRKTDAYLCNHVGIVDSSIYRGEIMLCFKNRDSLKSRAEIARFNSFINFISNGCLLADACELANNEMNKVLDNPMDFKPYNVGDRISQMVVMSFPNVEMKEFDELSETERGEGGFGSTGN